MARITRSFSASSASWSVMMSELAIRNAPPASGAAHDFGGVEAKGASAQQLVGVAHRPDAVDAVTATDVVPGFVVAGAGGIEVGKAHSFDSACQTLSRHINSWEMQKLARLEASCHQSGGIMRLTIVAAVGAVGIAISQPASADPIPPWLAVATGQHGYTVALTADVTTITITQDGYMVTGKDSEHLNLASVTDLKIEMDFASPCEFTVGCVISAPVDANVSGMAGELFVTGSFDGLAYDGGPATDNGFVSGNLTFVSQNAGQIFSDSPAFIEIVAKVPEPPAWTVLGLGLLGLCLRRRSLPRTGE